MHSQHNTIVQCQGHIFMVTIKALSCGCMSFPGQTLMYKSKFFFFFLLCAPTVVDKAVMTSIVFVDLKSDKSNCLLRTSDRRINIGGDCSMTAGKTWKILYLSNFSIYNYLTSHSRIN